MNDLELLLYEHPLKLRVNYSFLGHAKLEIPLSFFRI